LRLLFNDFQNYPSVDFEFWSCGGSKHGRGNCPVSALIGIYGPTTGSYHTVAPNGALTQNAGMKRKVKLRILIATLMASAFIGYISFVDRPGNRTFQAYVALSGQEPFGPINPPSPDSPDTVVLYRTGHGGVICFDLFHSPELHKDLLSKDGKRVTVIYDTFSDFGKVRGYNIHSIDAIVLANGYRVLRPDFASSAGIAGTPGSDTGSKDACW
jgi:hypothetical protein